MMGKIPAIHEVQLAQDYLQQDKQMNSSGQFSPDMDCRDHAGKKKANNMAYLQNLSCLLDMKVGALGIFFKSFQ